MRGEEIRWSANLAYAIGLITTDGSLSKDGRHIDLTSKDKEQILLFAEILNLTNKIGLKSSRALGEKKYYHIQFGNVQFYKFLLDIGLTPNKTKTIGAIKVPQEFFPDFLRGHLDGDGCTYSYWDQRWKSSFMLYMSFVSASQGHVQWLNTCIEKYYGLVGALGSKYGSVYTLRYGKYAFLKLISIMYYK